MSDRWVFLTAFLTVVLVVASAFAIPPFFSFELIKSLIYLAIVVLVFFGEDRFGYMLGIVAPPLWFILDILLGEFFRDFAVTFDYLTGKGAPPTDTPLHGVAHLAKILLVVLCWRAWRKQVPEKLFGKTFAICLGISLVYIGILAGWHFRMISAGGTTP
jgi:hypothetical protein